MLSSNVPGEMGQRDGTDLGLQASHETGHHDDGQDLHRPLHANYKKRNYPIDLGNVGIGLTQLEANHKLVKEWLNDGWLDKPKDR